MSADGSSVAVVGCCLGRVSDCSCKVFLLSKLSTSLLVVSASSILCAMQMQTALDSLLLTPSVDCLWCLVCVLSFYGPFFCHLPVREPFILLSTVHYPVCTSPSLSRSHVASAWRDLLQGSDARLHRCCSIRCLRHRLRFCSRLITICLNKGMILYSARCRAQF